MPARFDAREIYVALASEGVDYVTIGGVAVQAHGGQRMTHDLDVVIASSKENLEKLAVALKDLDARIVGPEGQRSAEPPSAALLGSSDQWHLVTDHGRLDVMTLPAHFGSFDEMLDRAHSVKMGGMQVNVATREDLIAMKRAAGRPQDLADVTLLESLD